MWHKESSGKMHTNFFNSDSMIRIITKSRSEKVEAKNFDVLFHRPLY